MRAVILAGGLGTRLREETEYRPKPMVEIGGRPIIWHIMKILGTQNVDDFVIALGYKGDQIKDFFLNYEFRTQDFSINLDRGSKTLIHGSGSGEKWNVTLSDTGAETMTGGRIFRLKDQLKSERFLCTYGDGLADIDLSALLKFHVSHGKIATVTAASPKSRFGSLKISGENSVTKFIEKPDEDNWVNAGYFIFEPEIFDYLSDDCVLEREPLEKLAAQGELMAYKHDGFWQPMDTIREAQELNDRWASGDAPWKIW